jgi:hypothetical protein
MFNSRTDPLTSEEVMLMLTPLIQDGTNFGSIKANTSSTRRDKFSLFKAKSILRIDKLLEKIRMMRTTRNGQFFTLMLLDHSHLQDTARAGACISTDLSSSKLD